MYRNILRKLNFFIFLFIAIISITIETTIFCNFPLHYIKPDFVLILSVYLGFRRNLLEGAALVIAASIIQEAHTSNYQHVYITLYLYAFVASQLLSKTVIISDLISITGIIVSLTVLKRLTLLTSLFVQGHGGSLVGHFFVYFIPSIFIQIVLTPLLFKWFKQIDLRTFKDAHAEDEYEINKEF